MKFPLPLFALSTTVLMVSVAGCGGVDNRNPSDKSADIQSVTIALNWYAEAEHGGYVAAKELGYFEDAGVNAEIQQGGPGAPNLVIQELAAGRIPFAISNADLVVLARSKGVPVVAVAAPLQHSPRCIMVHESSGITTLQELANVQLAISDSRPFALWMKHKLPLTNVTMIPYSGQVGEFVLNKNFAQQGYVFSEPFVARESGGDPRVLMLSEIGFDPYASLLVTTENLIKDNKELVRSVVHASVRGWEQYLKDPELVNQKIHDQNEEMSLESLAFGVDSMRLLCTPAEGSALCGMSLERWQTLVDQIEELSEIDPGTVIAAECFDTQFLP